MAIQNNEAKILSKKAISKLGGKTTRASKACKLCRKQKTRCFPSPDIVSCLRCISLDQTCSFEQEPPPDSGDPTHNYPIRPEPSRIGFASEAYSGGFSRPLTLSSGYATSDSRIKTIQNDVGEILRMLKYGKQSEDNQDAKLAEIAPRSSNATPDPSVFYNNMGNGQFLRSLEAEQDRSFATPSYPFLTSPFAVVGQSVHPNSLPYPLFHLLHQKIEYSDQDIITLGILTKEQAIALMTNFRDRYGRWVSFPDSLSTELLIDKIRYKCSLLLTTCCCLSLRYSDPYLKAQVYQLLLHKLQVDLNKSLLVIPQSIEFMQALVILSIYALSLSSETFALDGWFLSGVGLQHFVTKDGLGTLLDTGKDDILMDGEFRELTIYRIWNHLCLIHLATCVLSGRMCIIDEVRLDQSRKSLDLSSATNFDGRMVSEVAVNLIVYNFVQTRQSLANVREEMSIWHDQWSYLFEQPATQFVEFCYHFCYLLIFYNWNFRNVFANVSTAGQLDTNTLNNGEAIDQTLINSNDLSIGAMIFHSTKVLESLLVVKDDSYFAFLSDHIHFDSVFASMILIRILFLSKIGKLSTTKLSPADIDASLTLIAQLMKKFGRIATADGDTVFKYSNGLAEVFSKFFPEFELDEVELE